MQINTWKHSWHRSFRLSNPSLCTQATPSGVWGQGPPHLSLALALALALKQGGPAEPWLPSDLEATVMSRTWGERIE